MLQSLICLATSGQIFAWHALYASTHSGFSFTTCPNRRPGFFFLGGGCAPSTPGGDLGGSVGD